MVNIPGGNMQPLLTCLEDSSSPPEDKTDAYLRLAEDLAKEDKQFVVEVCQFAARLLSVLMRDMHSSKIDLSQAALQAVGYCIYQEEIVSSLREAEMSMIIQGLCDVVTKSTDKNSCTRALWSIAKQRLSIHVLTEKLPVILNTVEYALQTFDSTTVENEALDVVYGLVLKVPTGCVTSTAGQWCKLVYPLLISSAHKIREKALGILELELELLLLARQDVVAQLLPDLKGGLLFKLAKLFSDKKEVFVLRAWIVLVTILGETLHKGGNLINDMLKIPEQGFKSPLSNVQNMSYNAWNCLIDNFAISSAFIGSLKRIKLLMMPLLLHTGKVIHQDIELGRLQAWWHLVCAIKPEIYTTTTAFSEVCLPLLQYFFGVSFDSAATPLGHSKDGMRELTMPVTPAARGLAGISSPASGKVAKNTCKRKSLVFNKSKFPEEFVKQVTLQGCEILLEVLATNTDEFQKNKRLTEHLQTPILNNKLFQEHLPFFLAVVKAASCSCGSYLEDDLLISIWNNIVNRTVSLVQNGDPKSLDDVMASLYLTANDITQCQLQCNLKLRILDILTKIPVKYLLHSTDILSSKCCQGKPVFLLADILFRQLSVFKESYVDERFHIVFENLIDIGFQAPSGKLNTVHNIWLVLEGLASTVANVEDLWRFWSKVADSVTECVTKTSDVNQGDSLDPDFSLMISLLSFPFKQLFTGGLPVATTKELDSELAEFFRLFCRCASLVPSAEANTCIQVLSKSLINVVTQEKCKNVRFLDNISGLISVMMDCVDFSAQKTSVLPTLSSPGNLTPGAKSRPADKPLGNLTSLVTLSAKVLGFACGVDKNSSGSMIVAPAVTVLAGSLSKLFANLSNPQHIKLTIAALSSSISSFITYYHWPSSDVRSRNKKVYNNKFLLKIEKLWTDILMCLQSRYTADYDSQLLGVLSELLESTFCHQRRQFRNQTIMFWNATFGQATYLEYPNSLRVCLQKVLEKTPLTVPGWDQSKVASFDLPATLQDSEEMTPRENIIKQNVVIANSPKRKHGGSSPGKRKGSFLHKAFSSDKADRLSPFKNNLETGIKRKSPGSANARRKLPLPLNTADDKDYVVIAPSPKKKRLLTEHQKEVRKEKKLESGHPALYNMLDQSQDGMQFSEWSQASMTQSFNDQDVEMPAEKDAPKFSVDENDGETNKLRNSVQANITNLLDENRGEFGQVALPNDMVDGQNLLDKSNGEISDDEDLTAMTEGLTLPGGSYNTDNTETESDGNAGTDSKELNIDEDDDLIPSSQTTPRTSSRRKRCSYIHRNNRTPKSNEQFQDNQKNVKMNGTDKMELVTENGIKAPLETDLFGISSTHEESNQKDCSVSEFMETNRGCSSKTSLEPKCKISPKAPIASRTRLRKQYTPSKTKSLNIIESSPEKEEQTNEAKQPMSMATDVEEFSDHQMDDTQILHPDSTDQVNKTSSDSEVLETTTANKLSTIEPPSSPVSSSSMKFVHSKNSATGSPLNRPTRSFSSPACSPTTGILKRNRGNADTPSPPGKTRHVSFAFPLKEEKEIGFFLLDQIDKNAQDNHKKTGSSAEMTNNFTSIKATPTKSSTSPSSKEECVYPDLVECTAPVEQILPSLATSRWSRGLGHVVHAQNIRTVGNLCALTKDQVEKLPIRSPKVSTLRLVLRNFNENRSSKSSKVSQLRAITKVTEEAEAQVEAESGIVNRSSKLVDNKTPSVATNAEEKICKNNTPDLSEKEPVITAATPSSFVSTAVSGKMLTPKRSRFLVKPTTLFESDTESESGIETDCLAIGEVSKKQDVQKLRELETNSTDNKRYGTEFNVNEEKREKEASYAATDITVSGMTEEKISSQSENIETEIVRQSEQPDVPSAVVNVEVAYEMLDADLHTREQLKQENQTIPVEVVPSYEEPEHEHQEMTAEHFEEELMGKNQDMPANDVSTVENLKHENQKMVLDDESTTDELKQDGPEISVNDMRNTEEQKRDSPEMLAKEVSTTEELKYEDEEVATKNCAPGEDNMYPYVKAVNDLLNLQSQKELTELPLNILLLCQEQLMTMLSNTTTAIRVKCELTRK